MNVVDIAIVGKDVGVVNAYSSVEKALKLAASFTSTCVNIHWIDSHNLNKNNINDLLKGYQGILIPGGFNYDGVEGMILAISYARKNNIPFFGICLGMQLAVIEYARNVAGLPLATSGEFDKDSSYKVIDRLPNLKEGLREGSFPVLLKEGSLINNCYQSLSINEAFRHGYNLNNEYRDLLKEKGLILSAFSDNGFVEAVELSNHPFYIGVQFHPELSYPDKPHPLFINFLKATSK